MLFGTCNCNSSASSISRRGLLCAGGAGFVTALIGTLASSSRTAQAQALAKPLEVDNLAVRIVTDNQIIKFIPTEKRDGLTIERKPGGYLSKDAPPSVELIGEWGLSMHAESRRGNEVRNILIDFGYQSETLLNNMSFPLRSREAGQQEVFQQRRAAQAAERQQHGPHQGLLRQRAEVTAPTLSMRIALSASIRDGFSRAKSLPISQCSRL